MPTIQSSSSETPATVAWAVALGLSALLLGCGKATKDAPNLPADVGDKSEVEPDAQRTPSQLLDLAVEALGGESAHEKLKVCRVAHRRWAAAPWLAELSDQAAVVEDCYEHPDRLRRTIRAEQGGASLGAFVVNGNRMKGQMGKGPRIDRDVDGAATARPAVVMIVAQIVDARSNVARASVTEPCERDGHRVVGITFSDPAGRPRSTSYFDLESHLPVAEEKYAMPDMTDPPQSLKRVATMTTFYRDYDKFDGAVLPRTIVGYQNDRKVLESTLLEVEFVDSFEDGTFEFPDAGDERKP